MSERTRPVSRGPRPVAPTTRMPAAFTRASTSWLYALTVSSPRTSVPSRSVAISLGRPGRTIWRSFPEWGSNRSAAEQLCHRLQPNPTATVVAGKLSRLEDIRSDVRLQRGRDQDLTVGLLVV